MVGEVGGCGCLEMRAARWKVWAGVHERTSAGLQGAASDGAPRDVSFACRDKISFSIELLKVEDGHGAKLDH